MSVDIRPATVEGKAVEAHIAPAVTPPSLRNRLIGRKERYSGIGYYHDSLRNSRSFYPFLIAAIIVSALLLGATYFTWKSVQQIKAIQVELQQLPQFETRISDRLDNFNVGVQSMTDATNNRLSVLQGQLDSLTSYGPRRTSGQTAVSREANDPAANSFFIPEENKFRPYDASVFGDVNSFAASSARAKAAQRQDAATTIVGTDIRFRRIVAADGSVKYERIR